MTSPARPKTFFDMYIVFIPPFLLPTTPPQPDSGEMGSRIDVCFLERNQTSERRNHHEDLFLQVLKQQGAVTIGKENVHFQGGSSAGTKAMYWKALVAATRWKCSRTNAVTMSGVTSFDSTRSRNSLRYLRASVLSDITCETTPGHQESGLRRSGELDVPTHQGGHNRGSHHRRATFPVTLRCVLPHHVLACPLRNHLSLIRQPCLHRILSALQVFPR